MLDLSHRWDVISVILSWSDGNLCAEKRGITGRFPQTHMTRALRSESGKAPHLAVLIQPITVWLRESSQLCNVPCVWAVLTPTGKSMYYHQGGFVSNFVLIFSSDLIGLYSWWEGGGEFFNHMIFVLFINRESVNIHQQKCTEKKWSRYVYPNSLNIFKIIWRLSPSIVLKVYF